MSLVQALLPRLEHVTPILDAAALAFLAKDAGSWRGLYTEAVLTPGPGGTFNLPVQAVESWTNTPADMATPPIPGGTSLSRRMPLFVDWRNYSGGPVNPVLPPLGSPIVFPRPLFFHATRKSSAAEKVAGPVSTTTGPE